MEYTLERQIGNKKLTIETGKLASQAGGAVKVSYGDTVVLVTAVMANKSRPDIDFLPLTVEYEERLYAVGKEIDVRVGTPASLTRATSPSLRVFRI